MSMSVSKANSLVGSPIERIEDLRFLRGRGQFVDDIVRDGLLHAAILRSSIAHGRINAVDTSAALARAGVHAVVTAADVLAALGAVPAIPLRQEQMPAFKLYEQPVLAHGKVRYVGEPVAVVIADSAAIAEDALDAIALDITPLPVAAGRQTPDALLVESTGTNCAATLTAVRGDIDAAFKDAPYVRRERFRVQRHTAVPMEARGLLAEWDASRGRLTVYGAAKVAFAVRRILADQFSLPENAITMLEGDVGGAFGVRGEFYPEDFLVPFAARMVGRPVKWIEDRREHLTATNHARDVECEVEIACDRDGTIRGLRGHAHADVGAYLRTNGATGARNVAQVLSGPYSIPNIRIDVSIHVSNKTPVGTYRGPGRFEADFFRERLLEMTARDLGLDPVEFRRRNLIAEAQMPYALATVEPLNIATETDTGDYRMTLDRCIEEIGWSKKASVQGKLIDGRYHGLAVSCYIEGGASGPRENARMVLEADGRVSVYVGSSAVGQGIETIFAQIAADALELPLDGIRGVFHGSTTHVREGFGSFSSRSTVMGGSAVIDAAANLKTAIRAAVAKRLRCSADDVTIDGEQAIGPDRRIIAFSALAGDGVSAEGTYASTKRTYSYGAHAVHVAVDPRTGHGGGVIRRRIKKNFVRGGPAESPEKQSSP